MPTLYIVATPIGNLEDISLRALRVLKEVDLIACEDTRRTKILLNHYEIATPVVSYHQHSKLQKIDWLIEKLISGKDIALVSDAGTPGINDPGGSLVAAVTKRNYELGIKNHENREEILIVPIPGPNAGITLLSVGGITADQYLFLGYLPKKKGRATLLRRLAMTNSEFRIPIVLYESPYRLVRTLQDFVAIFPHGKVIIGRELTKKFEEIWRGTLAAAIECWPVKKPRGEFVLIVSL